MLSPGTPTGTVRRNNIRSQFCKTVKYFSKNYASKPEMAEARDRHDSYMNKLEKKLKKLGICEKFEYYGSSYEGVKVRKKPDDKDIEFDVMVIMPGGDKLQAKRVSQHPGFYYLRSRRDPNMTYYYSSLETKQNFRSDLQECINKFDNMSKCIDLEEHGPAVQVNVFKDASRQEKFYSVDMVPAYKVRGKLYVAKSPKVLSGAVREFTWRISFSPQEQEKFAIMDRDKGCRRKVLRVMKVIRNWSRELHALDSYHLKTALFMIVDEKKRRHLWIFDRIAVRLTDLMKKLEDQLASGDMPHYYVPGLNLIDWASCSEEEIKTVRQHLELLRTNKRELIKLMEKYEKQ